MIPLLDYDFVQNTHKLYEARIYRTEVGKYREGGEAVRVRPLTGGATRLGLWRCETPQPNEICELGAYAPYEDRLADAMTTSNHQRWRRARERTRTRLNSSPYCAL